MNGTGEEHDHPKNGSACGGTGGCGGHGDGACGGTGGCGGHPSRVPELNARSIDPAIRQSAIFGVLIGLAPQDQVVVVCDQDPAPIADLLEDRLPGQYQVAVQQPAELEWRISFTRC